MNTKTKFYRFSQNNSGGYFDEDEIVCQEVIIEAFSKREAIDLFEPMIEGQSPSCPCCGDRWYPEFPDEIDINSYKKEGYSTSVSSAYNSPEDKWFELYGKFERIEEPHWNNSRKFFSGKIYFENIEQYCQYLIDNYGFFSNSETPTCRIYFLDGTKKELFKTKKED